MSVITKVLGIVVVRVKISQVLDTTVEIKFSLESIHSPIIIISLSFTAFNKKQTIVGMLAPKRIILTSSILLIVIGFNIYVCHHNNCSNKFILWQSDVT